MVLNFIFRTNKKLSNLKNTYFKRDVQLKIMQAFLIGGPIKSGIIHLLQNHWSIYLMRTKLIKKHSLKCAH